MRKVVLPLLAALCLLFGGMTVYAMTIPQTNADDTINIIHINDVHGYAVETSSSIGYAKIAGFADDYRIANPDNTLFVDAGDVFQGNVYATFDQGESLIKILNTLGLDAMTAGNSEYMLGSDSLRANGGALNYPILGANMVKEGTDTLVDGTKAYEIITLENGKKVGIIGVTTSGSLIGNDKNYDYLDPVATAKKYANELRPQVDILVGLIHLGIGASDNAPARQVAAAVPEFDLLIDGHSHDICNEIVEGVPIVQAGAYSSGVGVVTLRLNESGKISSVTENYYPVAEFAGQSVKAETKAATDELLAKYDQSMNVKVGSASVFLEATRDVIRVRETNMGNLFTDAMREYTGADIAVVPSGNIGGDVGPGDITMGDVMTMARITGTMTTKEITGAQLLTALNTSIAKYPEQNAGMLQVSGVKFTFDPKASGNRVLSVKVGGEDLKENKVYTAAVFTGIKDSYEGIKDGTEVREWDFTYDILAWYFQKHSPVSPGVEYRMAPVSRIDYRLDGGLNHEKNSDTYTGEAAVKLYEPTKIGYNFTGWYTNSSFTDKISQIDAGTAEDITLYAKWEKKADTTKEPDKNETVKKQYTITFYANGGSVKTTKKTVTEGETYGTLPDAARAKYAFKGWYTAKSGGKKVTSATKATGNASVYAQWTKITVKKASISKLKNVSGKKAKVTLKKVSGANGYQIVYSTSKKFKSAKKTTATKTSVTLKKLKKGKTYYVKVRAYKLDSAGKKVYGKYSASKQVMIKK